MEKDLESKKLAGSSWPDPAQQLNSAIHWSITIQRISIEETSCVFTNAIIKGFILWIAYLIKWSKWVPHFLTNGLSGIDFMTHDPIRKPLINATLVYRLKQK